MTGLSDNTFQNILNQLKPQYSDIVLMVHYIAVLGMIIINLIIITQIGKLLKQKFIRSFLWGILFISIGVVSLLFDFGLADGASARSTPSIAVLGVILAIFVAALFMIAFGVYCICKIYITLAKLTNSKYFQFSWKLILAAAILFFTFILMWVFADLLGAYALVSISIVSLGFMFCSTLGQALFSIGVVKLKIAN